MSFLSSIVGDLLDMVAEQVKQSFHEYAEDFKQDAELFVDKMVGRIAMGIAVGLLGALLLYAGLIFVFIGVVTYLSSLISPALSWSIVGLALALGGAFRLNVLKRRGNRPRRVSKLGNGG